MLTIACAFHRDINESDVPELKASNFDGIPHADVDFVIQHSRLCCIISKAVRARWSLRATVDSQIETTREADEALGRFISQLPQQLQLSGPEMSPWKATLHLTYNNFLTLLHRPAPRNSLLDAAAEACSDMSICGVATTATASIFDTLRHRGLLLDLWLYDIHALLTAMIHVGCELKSSSPLVSARAQQTFESLMASLAVLARHWRFAQGLLNLFEQRARRRTATATSQQAPSESVPDMASSVSSTQTPGREWYGWNAVNSGQRNVYGGPDTPIGNNGGADMLAGTGKADRDGVGQPYDSNWGDGDLLVPGLPFPDASALEFFLADLGDGNQWTSL